MRRVLVTGAQGFLGRYLTKALLESSETEVVGCGRSPMLTGSFTHHIRRGSELVPAPLPESIDLPTGSSRYRYVRVDLLDTDGMESCLRECQPNTIFHLASALRDERPDLLLRTNVLGTVSLLNAIGGSGIPVDRLIVASSGSVYGRPRELPLREDALCRPVDDYGASKLAAEGASRMLASRVGIPCIWARLFNLVGAGQDERHVCARLVSQISAIARGGAPPTVYAGNLDSTRDYIDIRDAARALVEIADKGVESSIYNVASGIETPVRRILDCSLTLAALDGKISLEHLSGRAGDIPRHFAEVSRLAALGYERRYSLSNSLAELLSYYLTI
jgi:nucleoside-diphosphate-sugar epimerase